MNAGNHKEAISKFESIIDYKDSTALIEHCKDRIASLEAERLRKEKEDKEKAAKKAKTIKIAIPIVLACFAIIMLVVNVVIPSQKYNKAMAFIEAEDYDSAYKILTDLNYKDSNEKLTELISNNYKLAEVGDTIKFGSYEQDNNLSDGKEPIEWIVIKKDNNKLWLISKYCLDAKPFDNSFNSSIIHWYSCSLQNWLNNDFFNTAFDNTEQSVVLDTELNKNTYDNKDTITYKVFLISNHEYDSYNIANLGLRFATEYAKANGINDKNEWWKRMTPSNLRDSSGGVRPAMWISLED